jgi:hypothetical protein
MGLNRMVRAVLVAAVLVLGAIWLFDAARTLFSGVGVAFLVAAVALLVLTRRRHRVP